MALPEKIKLAFILPSQGSYSETFIRAQQEGLPFSIVNYTHGFFPTYVGDIKLLKRQCVIANMAYRVRRKVIKSSLNREEQRLVKSFKEQGVKAVLAQFGPTGEVIANVCRETGIPLIVHFHGADATKHDLLEQFNYYKNAFSTATKVICVSKAMQKQLLSIGCPEEKLEYNVYGPRDSFLSINPRFSDDHFIALGRFTDKKAPYYTILAFHKVLKDFPATKLTIGGEGELVNTCKNLVKYLEIENSVELPGILSEDEFVDHLKTCLAFVQHSVTADNGDSEGTPLSILEASAAGLPVISTNHAGIPDVIKNEVTGLLVNEHDVDGMAEAMKVLLKNREQAKSLGASGKHRILKNFSMNRHLNSLTQIIESAIGS